jgi:hypothetical protein
MPPIRAISIVETERLWYTALSLRAEYIASPIS